MLSSFKNNKRVSRKNTVVYKSVALTIFVAVQTDFLGFVDLGVLG